LGTERLRALNAAGAARKEAVRAAPVYV